MRVALAFPGCHRRGGVERVMAACANFLAARGHETHVFASDWDADAVSPAVVRHRVPAREWPTFLTPARFARRSRRSLRELRPAADALGVFGVQCPPGGVMWVQSVHKAWLEISGRHRDLKGRLRQRLNPFHPLILALEHDYFVRRKYRKLIALTPAVRSDLMRLYGVPAGDVVVLPNGYEPREFGPHRRDRDRGSVRARLGYRDEDRVVVFVANELERKGFGPLLRGVARLGRPDVHLLVAGRVSPGPYAAEIESLGLGGRVRFVGSATDVGAYYAAADVFALPTEYEAWGLVIVEALATGLPVLTSRLAGASAAVREGQTGALLDDPRSADEVAAKLGPLLDGVHRPPAEIAWSVAEYTWDRILTQYESVLAQSAAAGAGVGDNARAGHG